MMAMNERTDDPPATVERTEDSDRGVTRAAEAIRVIDLEISRLSPAEHVAVLAYLDARYVAGDA